MSITFNHDKQQFHLKSKAMSYIIVISKYNYLAHVY